MTTAQLFPFSLITFGSVPATSLTKGSDFMNILFAASEAVPYAASGGLADVAGTLPKVISEKGNNCAVIHNH